MHRADPRGHRFYQSQRALRTMIDGAVVQRVVYAKLVKRIAVVHLTADEFVGGDMGVGIDKAVEVAVAQTAGGHAVGEQGHITQIKRRTVLVEQCRVQFGFRIVGAAAGRLQHELGVDTGGCRVGQAEQVRGRR